MIDDVTLLRRFSHESSQEAFEKLVRRHIGLVNTAALRRFGNDCTLAKAVPRLFLAALPKRRHR